MIALAAFAIGSIAPEVLKHFLDDLAPDGKAEQLPLAGIASFQWRLMGAGGVVLLLGILLAIPRLRWADVVLESLAIACAAPRFIARIVVSFVRREPLEAAALAALTGWSVALSLILLDQPIRCDEAITALDFAPRTLVRIVSSYVDSNNHILHTLAVNLSWLIFGEELWSLRLPVLLAGAATVPAAYCMARRLFGRSSALLTAGITGCLPYMVDLATNARGYAMLNVIFLLQLAIGPVLLRGRSLPLWLGFVALSVAGFYTSPVMAFPFAVVVCWLAISGIRELTGKARIDFFRRVGVSIGVAGVLTGLLYTPTLVVDGQESVFLRRLVLPRVAAAMDEDAAFEPPTQVQAPVPAPAATESAPTSKKLLEVPGAYAASSRWELLLDLREVIWRSWRFYWMYGQARGLILFGSLLCLLFAVLRRSQRATLRLPLACIIGLALVTLASRSLPPFRSLSFLAPIAVVLFAAGVAQALEFLARGRRSLQVVGSGLVLLGLCSFNLGKVFSERGEQAAREWYVGYYDAEEAVEYLDKVLGPTDRIIGERSEMPPIEYHIKHSAPRLQPLWMTGGWWMTVARNRGDDIRNIYLISPRYPAYWRMFRRHELRNQLLASGYVQSDDVVELKHSRLIRFELPVETALFEGGAESSPLAVTLEDQ